jgi:hypothetical protein
VAAFLFIYELFNLPQLKSAAADITSPNIQNANLMHNPCKPQAGFAVHFREWVKNDRDLGLKPNIFKCNINFHNFRTTYLAGYRDLASFNVWFRVIKYDKLTAKC